MPPLAAVLPATLAMPYLEAAARSILPSSPSMAIAWPSAIINALSAIRATTLELAGYAQRTIRSVKAVTAMAFALPAIQAILFQLETAWLVPLPPTPPPRRRIQTASPPTLLESALPATRAITLQLTATARWPTLSARPLMSITPALPATQATVLAAANASFPVEPPPLTPTAKPSKTASALPAIAAIIWVRTTSVCRPTRSASQSTAAGLVPAATRAIP
jgi:hypothetical protein